MPEPEPALPAEHGEEAWERTHLEQTMFELARAHAAEAERFARSPVPDRQGERTQALVAILMSYFALEAFISMVGTDRLGSRYRYYDRMSPEGKWFEVTRLASKTGKTFAEEGREMRALSTLRSWRNMLTHYKGEYEEVERSHRGGETRTVALLSAENAARAVEIARTLYRAFYEFDRRSPPRQLIWLNDQPYQPPRAAAEAGRRARTPARAPETDETTAQAASQGGLAVVPSAPPVDTGGGATAAPADAPPERTTPRRRRGRRRPRAAR